MGETSGGKLKYPLINLNCNKLGKRERSRDLGYYERGKNVGRRCEGSLRVREEIYKFFQDSGDFHSAGAPSTSKTRSWEAFRRTQEREREGKQGRYVSMATHVKEEEEEERRRRHSSSVGAEY